MFNSTKARIQRGREFVSTHQSLITHTAVASTAAAVSYKLATQRMNDTDSLLGAMFIVAKTATDLLEEKGLLSELHDKIDSQMVSK